MSQQHRNIIKGTSATQSARTAGAPSADPASHSGDRKGRPNIVLHKTRNTIDALEVTCPCGHTMVIECQYDEENADEGGRS